MSDQLTPPGTQPYPRPQGAAYPTAPVPAGQYWAPPQPPSPQGAAVAPPRRGNGLAITALVLSAVALLVALGMAAFAVIGVAAGAGPGPSALTGRVTPIDKGVAGAELQSELTRIIRNDGGSVDTITCPDRSQVGQGLVTVCKGSVDGSDWTGVVVFEDDGGTFVLDEL
ncbi:hypothetical protein [Nostocoides sp. HKS02]|uniref:hypothetical protein n=1 Tax=Nostocoides sp. HKS02 TaxID=1813880 RepID=UPI0012B4E7B6|nr:hypothetical protein [Tetrasphaera sp. HKS02]QGN58526.1 hypothetical protein GKE56_12215 [Tetrasphaera sp. HKS02]